MPTLYYDNLTQAQYDAMTQAQYDGMQQEVAVLTTIAVTPSPVYVHVTGTKTFTATGYDQYGEQIATGAITWSVPVGTGSIDSGGLYTAPAASANETVRATSGSIHGDASVLVRTSAPSGPNEFLVIIS